jgi:hypothetical protein
MLNIHATVGIFWAVTATVLALVAVNGTYVEAIARITAVM